MFAPFLPFQFVFPPIHPFQKSLSLKKSASNHEAFPLTTISVCVYALSVCVCMLCLCVCACSVCVCVCALSVCVCVCALCVCVCTLSVCVCMLCLCVCVCMLCLCVCACSVCVCVCALSVCVCVCALCVCVCVLCLCVCVCALSVCSVCVCVLCVCLMHLTRPWCPEPAPHSVLESSCNCSSLVWIWSAHTVSRGGLKDTASYHKIIDNAAMHNAAGKKNCVAIPI